MKYLPFFVFGLALLGVTNVRAEESPVSMQDDPLMESATKNWLALQRGGEASSATPQSLAGPAMDQIYLRYIKSFSSPIPPFFQHVQPIHK